jgi:hypothetical protein
LLGSFVIGLAAILWYVGWFWLKIGSDKTQATAEGPRKPRPGKGQ